MSVAYFIFVHFENSKFLIQILHLAVHCQVSVVGYRTFQNKYIWPGLFKASDLCN